MVLDSLLASLASAEGPFVLEVLTCSCSLASATEVRLPVIRLTLSLSSLDQGQSLSGSVDPLAHLRASHASVKLSSGAPSKMPHSAMHTAPPGCHVGGYTGGCQALRKRTVQGRG